ncbi:oligosaccharide repeat unit polymerase [Methanothermococcus sp.]|uniref:oligosaccharide repeat unit polymerase n=1 Tax=Methanothermococcus sp. TaxID=2614238 RepID=UPI0025FC3143|nr:oligosaccharide repeat unit polymerase [Methanothermococcus sp.]
MNSNVLNKYIYKYKLDHPVIIVLAGHLAIFFLAMPYFYKFNPYSLLKIFSVIFLYILFYSLPFLVDNYVNKNKNINIINKYINNPYAYSILLFVIIYYGIYTITNSFLLSILYPLLVIGILNLFAKCTNLSNNGSNNYSNNNGNFFINILSTVFKFLSKYIDEFIFGIGVISFILIVITYNAIPLFNYDVRMEISADPLRLISTGALVYGGINNIFYFIISFILIALLGYKAGILILCVSFLIFQYKSKKIPTKWLISSIIGLFIVLTVMSKVILLSSGQNWKIGILGMLSYRAYFDMLVLEKIINYSNLMLGNIIFNPTGEKFIGEILFNYSHNITSTMFGPVYLDFGIFGVLFALLFGMASKLIYNGDKKLYAIYASILLSMCEIGINYGFLIVMLVFLYMNSLKIKK